MTRSTQSCQSMREHNLQTTWLYNFPLNQSASPCSCRRASIRHICHKCCTLTPKYYSNCPVVFALFGFSASVKCYCWSLSMSSHAYFIINPIKQTAWTRQYCSKAWCYFQYVTVDLVMAARTARRITCLDGAFKCCKVQPMFQFSWNLTEASRQCCLCSLSSVPLPGVQVA